MAEPKQDIDLILAARRQAAQVRESGSGAGSHGAASPEVAAAGELTATFLPQYELFEELHRGGQGVVYRAQHRSSGRIVAIKVLREGPFAGRADRIRFEREVQILGALRHPNIVTIHDSGSAGGFFYYVMDFVEGLPLDQAIANFGGSLQPDGSVTGAVSISAKSQLRAIVALFAQIADAVNEAHLRGIIHRDLKPGNILVSWSHEATEPRSHEEKERPGHSSSSVASSLRGSVATPKILDFGLARQISGPDESGDARLMTQTGQFIGSLPWASPEQVEGRRDGLDLRTDVYSLGVLLYHALTGTFPVDTTGALREAMGRIVTIVPPPPSARRRGIDRELDAITLRCLAKEPARRYQNAGELARDLRRYLAGEAIDARRDSALYVLRKLAGRHRVALLVAACFAGTVTAAAIALGVMYARQLELTVRAEGLAQTAAQERDRASAAATDSRARFRMARETVELLLEEFSTKLEGVAGTAKLREDLMTQAYERYQQLAAEESDDPGLTLDLIRVRDQLGTIAIELGRLGEAEAHYETALCWIEPLAVAQPYEWRIIASHAAIYNSLGDLAMRRRDRSAAQMYYERHYEINARLLELNPNAASFLQRVAVACDRLGVVATETGRTGDAQRWYADAHALRERLLLADPSDPTRRAGLATSHNRLGELARVRGDRAGATAHFERSIEIGAELVAELPEHPAYAHILSFAFERLSAITEESLDMAEAREWAEKMFAVKDRLALAAPDNPTYRYELAVACMRMARIVGGSDPRATERYLEQAIGILEPLCAAEPDYAPYHENLAQCRSTLAALSSGE